VPELSSRLREILGLGRQWKVCIIGAGRIGAALAGYTGFTERGFLVSAVYDSDPAKIGTRLGDTIISDESHLERDIATNKYQIAVLAVPAEAAQKLADRAVRAGIKGVLNFAPVQLNIPDHVALRAVNMAMELEALTFAITNKFD
jgi:redox-sensing transcriptional repressor